MDNFTKMWFGTEDFALWIEPPLSGSDSSPAAWNEGGTLLTGSAYQVNSYNSHKTYTYSWPPSSSREQAQLMKSFYEGTYGRGKIYFIDPLAYDINVFPARWADPSITANFEGPSLFQGVEGVAIQSPYIGQYGLPIKAMQYSFVNDDVPADAAVRSLKVPLPEGSTMYFTPVYSFTGNAQLYYAYSGFGTGLTAAQPVPPATVFTNSVASATVFPQGSANVRFLHVFVGSNDGQPLNGTITISGMSAKMLMNDRYDAPSWATEPYRWVGGQGHEGVRFDAPPTYVPINGVGGGQIEYAASFVESVI